jgi:multidrug efflux system outer membrane protein
MTRFALSLIAAAALSACSLAPMVPQPDIVVPSAYKQAPLSTEFDGTRWKAALPAEAAARGAWWEAFGDAQLNALEVQAIAANPNLVSAAARVKAARASLRGVQAERWVQVGVDAAASRSRPSAVSLGLPSGTSTGASNVYQANLGASYEIDLFNRVGNAVNAAQADAQAVEASYRSVLLALQADVAQTYYALRTLDAEIAQLDATVKLRDENAGLIGKRFQAGDVGELDVARSRTDLATVQAEAVALRNQRTRFEHVLAQLLGQTPSQFSLPVSPLEDAASVPVVPPGLPSALLERRPDVTAAQHSLQAETARVGQVRAALFPALALTANGGYASGDIGDLFKWSSRAWLASLVFSLPVIDGGRNKAAITRAEASLEGAVADYRQTVLGAFADVENQLASLRAVRDQVALTDTAVSSAKRAAELANIRYRAGEDSYQQLIDTQRGLLAVQRQAVKLRGDWAGSTVALIRALGGGWDAAATP